MIKAISSVLVRAMRIAMVNNAMVSAIPSASVAGFIKSWSSIEILRSKVPSRHWVVHVMVRALWRIFCDFHCRVFLGSAVANAKVKGMVSCVLGWYVQGHGQQYCQ